MTRPPADLVERRDHLRQQRRVAEADRRHQRAELDARGHRADRGQRRPRLEDRHRRHRHAVQMVVEPHRVEPEAVELASAAARVSSQRRLICGSITPNCIVAMRPPPAEPSTRHDEADEQAAERTHARDRVRVTAWCRRACRCESRRRPATRADWPGRRRRRAARPRGDGDGDEALGLVRGVEQRTGRAPGRRRARRRSCSRCRACAASPGAGRAARAGRGRRAARRRPRRRSRWPPFTSAAAAPSVDQAARGAAHGRRATAMRTPSSASASGHVRRHHRRQRQQLVAQRRARVVLEQPRAALRHHHRVDHQRRDAVRAHRVGDGVDDGAVGQHAGLRRVDADVARHRVDLRPHELRRHRARCR